MRITSFTLAVVSLLSLPVLGQTPGRQPQIILPSKEKKPEAEALPVELRGLGTLGKDLVAYFSMNAVAKGCLSWSRKPIAVQTVGDVKIKEADGRTYADFSEKGAHLVFEPPLDLGRHFTLTAWVQTPAPQKYGTIWQGVGELLSIRSQVIGFWHKDTHASGIYAKLAAPMAGWVHVAVTCDGKKTQAFLNGIPLDPVDGVVSNTVASVGSQLQPQFQDRAMAAGIDEQYYFHRTLTVQEIKKVMRFTASKK